MSVDLDTRLINAIIKLPPDRVFSFLNMNNLHAGVLLTRKKEFQFLRQYIAKHGQSPSSALFKRKYPGFPLINVKDPLEELVFEALKRTQHNLIAGFVSDIDPEDMQENLDEYIKKLQTLSINVAEHDRASTDHEYSASFESRLQTYNDRKTNLDKVTFTTGVSKMDEYLGGGFVSPQLVVVAGDPKMGKTWFLCNLIAANYKVGKVPLLITPEMDHEEISFRLDSLRFELPFEQLRMGKLNKMQEARWRKRAQADMLPLHIIDTTEDSDFTPSKVLAKIELYRPDFVVIDSAYYMRADGTDLKREENYQDRMRLVKQLKSICKGKRIPIVCVVQMRAEQEKSKDQGESALRNVYGGDHWAQGCDILLRLRGSRAEKYRRLVLLANREGETFKEAIIKYEFDPCPKFYSVDDAVEDDAEQATDVVEVEA